MTNVEDRLQAIEKRNKRVELEKAWETSVTRKMSIALLTYGTAFLFLWIIGNPDPVTNSLVPMGGYVLSTLSIPSIKRVWIAMFAHKISQAAKGDS